MGYSIEDIRKEFYTQKQRLEATRREIELLEKYKEEGKEVDKLIEEKKKEVTEIEDIIQSILEYCLEKKADPNKAMKIIQEFNDNQKRYEYLEKNYKFKSKRILEEMKAIENRQNGLLKEIDLEKIPCRPEITKLEKLSREIDDFLKGKSQQPLNPEIEDTNVIINKQEINDNLESKLVRPNSNTTDIGKYIKEIEESSIAEKDDDLMKIFFNNDTILPKNNSEQKTPEKELIKQESNTTDIGKYIKNIKEKKNNSEKEVPEKELNSILFEGKDAIKPEMPEEAKNILPQEKPEAQIENFQDYIKKEKIKSKVRRKRPLAKLKERIEKIFGKKTLKPIERMSVETVEGDNYDRGKSL